MTAAETDPTPPTVTCPDCGDEIAAVGKQTPAAAVGLHRRKIHNVTGVHAKGPKVRRSRQADPDEIPPQTRPSADHSVVRAISEGAQSAGAGKSKSRPPTQVELEKMLSKVIVAGTGFAADAMVAGDPRDVSEQAHQALADPLTMDGHEAGAVARPIANLMASSKINARVGRKLVDNVGLIETATVLAAYVSELRQYRRDRREAMGNVVDARTGPPSGKPPTVVNATTVNGEYWAGTTSAGDSPRDMSGTQGVVVTPEMVAKMTGRPAPMADVNAGPDPGGI